jgi:hypothetical protein
MSKKAAKTHEVSALRTPGFNAEASLYIPTAMYRSGGGSIGNVGAVQPAAGLLNPGTWVGGSGGDGYCSCRAICGPLGCTSICYCQ